MSPTDAADATDLAQYELPEEFAERSATVLETDEPPATVAAWTEALAAFLADATLTIGPEELCTTAESRHRAEVDGAVQHYRCVLDALLVPFVDPAAESVEVRSQAPHADEVVGATVGPDVLDVDPATAVVSLGLAADAPPVSELDRPPLEAYDLFCPFVNAFPERETYEAWAAETPEAVTTAVPFDAGLAVAERLANAVAADAD